MLTPGGYAWHPATMARHPPSPDVPQSTAGRVGFRGQNHRRLRCWRAYPSPAQFFPYFAVGTGPASTLSMDALLTHNVINYSAGYSPRRSDQPLGVSQDPPVGAHLTTPRRGYAHHGIYVGGGQVVQYSGLGRTLRAGPVEKVSLAEFSRGRSVWIQNEDSVFFDRHEVVRRALSRIGEDRYHILTNNCEHFCEWCLRGQPRSYQLEQWRPLMRRVLSFALRVTTSLLRQRSRGGPVGSEAAGL